MISGRSVVFGAIFGVLLYLILAYALGFAAALAFPPWYTPFALENKVLSLVIWSLVTSVPLIVVVSATLGWILSRLVAGKFLAAGLVAVFVAMLVNFVGSVADLGVIRAIWVVFVPNHWIEIPTYVALYCSLPIATWYWGRRRNAA